MNDTATRFVWDGDYKNHEQVRPYMADFLAVYAELEAGSGTYNHSFRGRIPGIEDYEDTAIYMLQNLKRLDELAIRVAEFEASGGRHVTELDETVRGTVVFYGFYMGGTGWQEYHDARLLARGGRPYAVLPKGKRTNGHLVQGRVMVREG